MEQGFIDILKKVVDKHGKEYFLETKKCNAIVADYTGSEYRIERGLLIRAVEAGVSRALFSADKDDVDRCMKVQQRNLQEEQFMDTTIAWNVVNALAHVLHGVALQELRTEPAASTPSAVATPSAVVTPSAAAVSGVAKGGNKYDEAVVFYWDEQYDKALTIFEALARDNHAGAQTYLGMSCYYGSGVKKDFDKAIEWYRKAADQGYADAIARVGTCYADGQGVPQDYTKAVEWYRKAADKGDVHALNHLAFCYKEGDGLPQDYAKAVELYRKAAEQGEDDAQYDLGECYEEGIGVEQNLKEAMKWYRKSAAQGNVLAEFKVDDDDDDDD